MFCCCALITSWVIICDIQKKALKGKSNLIYCRRFLRFSNWLHDLRYDFRVDRDALKKLCYAICALGDSAYGDEFNVAAANIDKWLGRLGATRIYPLGECDKNADQKEWSKKIDSKDGFIFVTPQYNWGYPAALKNCVDYLKKEWLNKPAMIASYANRTGGDKAAAQFRQVLDGLRMRPVETMPAISFTHDMFNENGKIKEEYGEFNLKYSDTINKAILELELNKPQEVQVHVEVAKVAVTSFTL